MATPSPVINHNNIMAEGRSLVWHHFSKENNDVICNKCQTIIKTKQGNTTNLHKHLKRHHDIELEGKSKKTKYESATGMVVVVLVLVVDVRVRLSQILNLVKVTHLCLFGQSCLQLVVDIRRYLRLLPGT